jgi:hypothetical protein
MNKITHVTKPAKPKELKAGQFYSTVNVDGAMETYMIAKISVCDHVLVCLDDGHFWSSPRGSIIDIFGGSPEKFELVTQPFTISPDNN